MCKDIFSPVIRLEELSSVRPFLAVTAFLFIIVFSYPLQSGQTWLQNVEIPSEWTKEPVIVQLDSTLVTVAVSGKGNELLIDEETEYLINRTESGELKTIEIHDYESFEKKPQISVTVRYENGDTKDLSGRHILRSRRSDSPEYRYSQYCNKTSEFITTITLPRYEQGMRVKVSCKRRVLRPELFGPLPLRKKYHTIRHTIRLEWPDGLTLDPGVSNPESLTVEVSHGFFGTRRTCTITALHVKKRPATAWVRDPASWFAAVLFSVPPKGARRFSWTDFGNYHLQNYLFSLATDSVVDRIARTIRRPTEEATIAAAFTYVKDAIRYYGSWEEMFSWVPRHPAEVVHKGFGDCKEMAILLTLVLRGAGIEAHPVLVNTEREGPLVDSFAVGNFNHMICCARCKDGTVLFLDATNKIARYTESYLNFIDTKALLIQKDSTRIITIDRRKDYVNSVETETAVSRGSDAGWTAEGSITLRGHAAWDFYYEVKSMPDADMPVLLRDYLRGWIAVDPAHSEIAALSPDSAIIRYFMPFSSHFINETRPGLILDAPGLFGLDFLYALRNDDGPLYVRGIVQKDQWKVPPGFTVLESNECDGPLWTVSWTKGKGVIARTVIAGSRTLAPPQRDLLRKALQKRTTCAQATIWTR